MKSVVTIPSIYYDRPKLNLQYIVARHPAQVAVTYKGLTYTFVRCGTCQKFFWFCRTSPHRRGWFSEHCSSKCRETALQIMNRNRQRRWKDRQRAGPTKAT